MAQVGTVPFWMGLQFLNGVLSLVPQNDASTQIPDGLVITGASDEFACVVAAATPSTAEGTTIQLEAKPCEGEKNAYVCEVVPPPA